jgi:hypothetical protein
MEAPSAGPRCPMVQAGAGLIRCPVCGTKRQTNEHPDRYHRACGVPLPAAKSDPEAHPLVSPCRHRGDVVETSVCNTCGRHGQPFEIFACPLHGACQAIRYRTDRPELQVCGHCADYAPADAPA